MSNINHMHRGVRATLEINLQLAITDGKNPTIVNVGTTPTQLKYTHQIEHHSQEWTNLGGL